MAEKNNPNLSSAIHSGHRSRMLETFLQNGIDGFSDIQLLEFLLSYSIPRTDTNPLAHRLIDEFGDLNHIFHADVQRLTRVNGIGPRTAALIRFVGECWSRTERTKYQKQTYLRNYREIGDYLVAHIGEYREERAFLLSLDANCKLIEMREICRGDINMVNVPYRKIVEAAVLSGATSVVLAHTHVNGSGLPSVEDVNYTKGLIPLLSSLNIVFVDHMIISERSYVSMLRSSWI